MKRINWKYALGEILIVIIGITIAFSLNQCAQDTADKKTRNTYLVNLQTDIQADKEKLEEILTALERKIELSDSLLPVLNSDRQNDPSIARNVFEISSISGFSPNNITYQTLINSGDLKLLDDFNLKTAIEKHYSNYDEMMKTYERQENIHKDYLGPYFIYNTEWENFRKGESGFKDQKLLKNIVQSMRGSFGLKLNATKAGIASCDTLLVQLSKYLED